MKGGFAPTKRQLRVLIEIAKAIATRGYSPTMRELGNTLGITSTNGVHDHLVALERRGLITRLGARKMSRRVALTDHGVSFVGEIAPKKRLQLTALPHVVIGPVVCGQCGATRFDATKACVICRLIATEAA